MIIQFKSETFKGLKICLEVHEDFPELPLIACGKSRSNHAINKLINRLWPLVYIEKGRDPNIFLSLVDYLIMYYQHFLFGIQCQTALKESSAALKLVLNNFRDDQFKLRNDALKMIGKEILPNYLALNKYVHGDQGKRLYKSIRGRFVTLTNPAYHTSMPKTLPLTSKEISVANLVQYGIQTKDISEIFAIAPRTVEYHRNNIRRKLGIQNKQVKLETELEKTT